MKTLKELLIQPIDLESFMVHEHTIGGKPVKLIQPQHVGCKWTQDNSIFRSLVVDMDNNIVSASWKKFVNWGENPEHFPVPQDITKCELVNKEDGSTLICSIWNGNLIMRTRGTVDASKIDNGYEIEFFKQKYPQIKTTLEQYDSYGMPISILFEWCTPTRVIVIKHPEPELILTGIVFHRDYTYMTQVGLDVFAKIRGFKRPIRYRFNDIAEMLEKVPSMTGIEGLCVYHNNDQCITKIKCFEYLKIHRFKEHANIGSVIELYFGYGKPSYPDFVKILVEKFDYECFVLVQDYVKQVGVCMIKVEQILFGMIQYIESLRHLSKKEAALKIIETYGPLNQTGYAFSILNNKPLVDKQLENLLYSVL